MSNLEAIEKEILFLLRSGGSQQQQQQQPQQQQHQQHHQQQYQQQQQQHGIANNYAPSFGPGGYHPQNPHLLGGQVPGFSFPSTGYGGVPDAAPSMLMPYPHHAPYPYLHQEQTQQQQHQQQQQSGPFAFSGFPFLL